MGVSFISLSLSFETTTEILLLNGFSSQQPTLYEKAFFEKLVLVQIHTVHKERLV